MKRIDWRREIVTHDGHDVEIITRTISGRYVLYDTVTRNTLIVDDFGLERGFAGDYLVVKNKESLENLKPEKSRQYPAVQAETLRDKFAMAALTGYLASIPDDVNVRPDLVARSAYEMADAMMEAREMKNEADV